jgi:hypothetical protein
VDGNSPTDVSIEDNVYLDIWFGDYIKRMEVYLLIAFVIGDQKSNIHICGVSQNI